ncbi:MAG: hypothetical protein KKD28_11710 [Chloroflexi bacterium]|nr:hypothetical protein [Chloroflexota bacterium]
MKLNRNHIRTSTMLVVLSVALIQAFFGNSTARGSAELPKKVSNVYQNQNHHIYLPVVMNNFLTEVDIPPCRWHHNIGSYTWISYKWGRNLWKPGVWRSAFEAAISDWNGVSTKIYFYSSSSGPTTFNTYSADDGYGGYAQPFCSGTTTVKYEVWGNSYYSHTTNEYHAYAGHETGHGQSIGHLSGSMIALMGFNPDPNIYYTPQQPDIDLVDQIYP